MAALKAIMLTISSAFSGNNMFIIIAKYNIIIISIIVIYWNIAIQIPWDTKLDSYKFQLFNFKWLIFNLKISIN